MALPICKIFTLETILEMGLEAELHGMNIILMLSIIFILETIPEMGFEAESHGMNIRSKECYNRKDVRRREILHHKQTRI